MLELFNKQMDEPPFVIRRSSKPIQRRRRGSNSPPRRGKKRPSPVPNVRRQNINLAKALTLQLLQTNLNIDVIYEIVRGLFGTNITDEAYIELGYKQRD